MKAFDNHDAIIEHVGQENSERGIVAIDGWTGVGKSTLARSMAKDLGWSYFDLDDALGKNRKVYFEALRIPALNEAVKNADGLLVVAGVQIIKALQQAGLRPNVWIYVKRMAVWGWTDEDEILGSAIPEVDLNGGGAQLRSEMREYHRVFKPHELSDICFNRLES